MCLTGVSEEEEGEAERIFEEMAKTLPNLMKILNPQIQKAQETQRNVKHKKHVFIEEVKLRHIMTSCSEPVIKRKI